MKIERQLRLGVVSLSAFFCFLPAPIEAQQHTAGAAGPATSTAHPASSVRTVRVRPAAGATVSAPRANPVRANTAVPGNPFGYYGPGNFGPGMAFAPSSTLGAGNLGIEAAIDPATQWRIATAEKLFRLHRPSNGIGYYLLTDGGYGYDYAVPDDNGDAEGPVQETAGPAGGQQQPIIVVEQGGSQGNGAADEEPPVEPQPPLPDIGQFTLVLRNGKKIEAVAFTELNGKIIYVTPEGNRRTINLGDVDTDATKELNEESGTSVKL